MMVTFPGYSDIPKFTIWYENTYYPILKLSIVIWGVLNIVSTMATIVGIYKMIHSLQKLKKYNSDLKTSYFQFTIHTVVLTMNLVPVILYCLPYTWFTDR
jgi:hypothetical protein